VALSFRDFVPLLALLGSLLVVMLLCGITYIDVMFDGQVAFESTIEAANYAAQTVTTVGYGNWVPSAWDLKAPELARRVLIMKEASVFFVLIGASIFCTVVGLVANLISRL
jgi:hypothetical protein